MDSWDLHGPHIAERVVLAREIDSYGHVNNAFYLVWIDETAWSHSRALGVQPEDCLGLRRGMVVHRAELDYLRGALEGDHIEVATWIVETDYKLRVTRRFQVRRVSDGVTLLRARMDYVCMNLDSGRAARMPPIFAAAYRAGT
jgi:acyl-CoA thioester hydrolase